MVLAGNKAKCLSSVNHTTKKYIIIIICGVYQKRLCKGLSELKETFGLHKNVNMFWVILQALLQISNSKFSIFNETVPKLTKTLQGTTAIFKSSFEFLLDFFLADIVIRPTIIVAALIENSSGIWKYFITNGALVRMKTFSK